jgi:hypothetical protein
MQQSPHESEQDHHGAWFAEAADAVLGNNFDAVAKSCFLTTLKLLDNVIQEPHNPVYRSVNLGNKTVQAKILWANGGWELLLACGFVPDESSEDRLVLPLNEQGGGTTRTLLSRCIAGRKLLANRLVNDLHCPMDLLPSYKPPPARVSRSVSSFSSTSSINTSSTFNAYQAKRFDSLSAAVGVRLGPDDAYKSPTVAEVERLEWQRRALQEKSKRIPLPRQWHATRPDTSSETTSNMMHGDVATAIEGGNDGGSDMGLLAARALQQSSNAAKAEKQGFTTAAHAQVAKVAKNRRVRLCDITVHVARRGNGPGPLLPRRATINRSHVSRDGMSIRPQCNV